MTRPVFLKAQNDLLTEIEEEVGSPSSGGLWTKKQIYRAISNAVELWAGKVLLPRLYYFDSEFSSTDWFKAIPSYIRGEVDVQIRLGRESSINGDSTNSSWATIFAGSLEIDDDRGEEAVFRWQTAPYQQEGRIFWYASNGPVFIPTHDTNYTHTLNATINSSATSLVINGVGHIPPAGWLKLDGEFIGYSDVDYGVSTTTCQNLTRGLMGTAAASHTLTTCMVYSAIGVDDNRLWQQLKKQAMANLHEMKLHRGGLQDRRNHQEMVNHLQGEADAWWKKQGYTTQRDVRTYLTQYAIGRTPWF